MTVTSDGIPRERLRWLKNNVLVALTILGILLYAVFSIPATFFYARLGTTPSEVGFTYATILSGSTLGALLILGLFLLALFYAVEVTIGLVLYSYTLRIAFSFLRHPTLAFPGWELDADQFKRKLTIIKKLYKKDEAAWGEVEPMLQRRRELKMSEHPTATEKSEIKAFRSKIPRLLIKHVTSLIIRVLRPRVWYIYFIFPLLVIATVVFTLIALYQANQVINGTAGTTSQPGLFDYRIEPVKINPAGPGDGRGIHQLVGKQIYLLGQNAQYIILYVPQQRSTVRIPTSAIIVSSSP
jgi:amino acid transporter